MNQDLVLDRLTNNIIDYTIITREKVYGQLSWSHFCELIGIKDENERNFYEKETINSKWSTRELCRQIESGLYQRLLLSNGAANKEKVLQLAKEGQIIEKPKDIIKEPYVFEFLGIQEEKPL